MLFWIVASILAVPMLLFGGMKVVRKRSDLEAMGMLWAEDYADSTIKLLESPKCSVPSA